MKMKLPGDITGGVGIFVVMFLIALVEMYLFKNVKAFGACACAGGHCVGDCGGQSGGRACACTNGNCVGDCDGGGGGGGKGGGGKGKGGGGKGGGGKGKGGNGKEEDGGGGDKAKPAPSKPAAPAPSAPAPSAPAPAASNCSCMPMDSDPSRQKIETPDGTDCANHEYPGSVAECETLLATVASSPCCTGGGGDGGDGEESANLAYVPRIIISRIIMA